MTAIAELRVYDPNRRPAGMGNWYCARCRCNKSGYIDEPNPVTEACDDPRCLCHRERRCGCCDGHDGLGVHHFATIDQLRAWLALPDREQVCDIDLEQIPDEPYGMSFVTAGDAMAWLEDYDEWERYEAAIDREWERRAEAAGVKL